jgi:3,4-dihydroxy 2-butanone 4-phosphate synthase/GTP cyclohydrolase II
VTDNDTGQKSGLAGGNSPVSSIEDAVEDIRLGRMIILVDDEDRENEGDIFVAADKVTPEHINFMMREARGLICLPLTTSRADELGLRMMVPENTTPLGTGFTVSIDSRKCGGLGMTASDRALTIREAVREGATASDFLSPGHVFPLRARDGGVLVRTGQTEGSVDISRLAGLSAAGVICEILNEDGTMARMPELVKFSQRHSIRIATIADLIQYRLQTESLVKRLASSRLPTRSAGEFEIHVYGSDVEDGEHVALVKGRIDPDKPVLVRTHAEYLPGDVFAYSHRNTGALLEASMRRIDEEGAGVVLYVRRHGRGAESLSAGSDGVVSTSPASRLAAFKDYGIGAQILRDLGVRRIRLLTNTPPRLPNLAGYGLEVVETVPIAVPDDLTSGAKTT